MENEGFYQASMVSEDVNTSIPRVSQGVKVLFILGVIVTAIALIFGCFATYFGVAALISQHAHGADADAGTAIGLALMLIFMVLCTLVSGGASVLAAILLLVRPARAQVPKVRRVSRVLLVALLVMVVLQGVVWVLCML